MGPRRCCSALEGSEPVVFGQWQGLGYEQSRGTHGPALVLSRLRRPFISVEVQGGINSQGTHGPTPVLSRLPVPGKNSSPNWWKEAVITRLVVRKASSTPSPWCTSTSMYSTCMLSNVAGWRVEMLFHRLEGWRLEVEVNFRRLEGWGRG